MGQAAEDAISGLACEWCGIFFERPHGHPVVCEGCWKNSSPNEHKGHIKAYIKELQ